MTDPTSVLCFHAHVLYRLATVPQLTHCSSCPTQKTLFLCCCSIVLNGLHREHHSSVVFGLLHCCLSRGRCLATGLNATICIKCLGIFLLLSRCNDFAGTPIEVSHDRCIAWELLTGDTHKENNCREHIQVYNSAVALTSVDAEIKLPGSGPSCFLINN
jgi:hypothetical protein